MKEDEKLLLDYEKLDDKYSSHFHPRDRNIENKLPNLKDNHSNLELFLYIIIVTFLVFVLLFIFYFVHFGEYKVEVLLEDKDIFKPVIDMRKYKLIKLQNDLQVFLISDKNTTKCSASLTVGVGSFYDGKIPGLAHFTEHMIFLGSKSYPRPSTFEDHLRNFLGYTNAYTEEERTTFFFDVEWQGFTKALEMFSRMLAEPLFDKEYMNKEIEAVNSENEKNFNKDPWRENQIIKSLANPLHPYSNFMTGNRETLTSPGIETLYTAVTALYDKYYMPDNMKLVVLSNQNLEQLQATVSYFFSDVRREKVEENLRKMTEKEEEEYNLSSGIIPTPNSPYYNPYLFTYPAFKKAGKILWYQKVAGGQHVDIIFNLKEISSCYKTKPLSYLTYLLKFSGEGSLINYLRKNKLSSKLEVGVVASYKTFSQYAISVYLTEEGLQNIKTVIILVFNYLNLIRSSKLKEETFEELRNITSVSFRFLEKSEKYGEYLATIASSMFSIPENEYFNLLQADYIHTDYNETLTKSYLNEMIAEKSFIIVGSVNYPDSMDGLLSGGRSQREKWYLTNYTVSSIPYDFLRVLNSTIAGETFKLREQNNFITNERNVVSCFGVGIITSYKNVTLHELCDLEKVDLTPDFAINSTNLQAWYKLDRTFLAPRVNVNFLLVSSYSRTGSKNYFYLNLFYNYVKSMTDLKLAEARDSGNTISLEFNENGISIFISAYTDLIERITDRIMNVIFNCEIDENNYINFLGTTRDDIGGSLNNQPYEKAVTFFLKVMKNNMTTYDELLRVASSVSFKEFYPVYKDIQKSFFILSQFYGNMNEKQLLTIESYIQPYLNQDTNLAAKNLNIKEENLVQWIHMHRNLDGSYILRKVNDLSTDPNNAIVNYFQIGKRDLRLSLIMNIIELSWENIFFYNLRTVKQLGYIVAASKFVKDNYLYYLFLVQGSKSTPDSIDIEIDKVIEVVRTKLLDYEEEKINEFKQIILEELNKKSNNLKERSDFVWKEILEDSLEFDRKYKLIEELDTITKEDIIKCFEDTFYYQVKKLSIQIYSQNNFEKGVISGKYMEEKYNLNPSITTIISDDFNLLNFNKN